MPSIKMKFRPSTVPGRKGTVCFQVICNRKAKLITSPYRLFPDEWDTDVGRVRLSTGDAKREGELIAVQNGIDDEIQRLRQTVSHLQSNGQDVLERLSEHLDGQVSAGSVFAFMESLIQNLRQEGRTKTAGTYTDTRRSLSKFLQGGDIYFSQMDAALVKRYEGWLKGNGLRLNTVSFYMRILRAVYNKAVEQGLTVQQNPFRQVYTGIEKTSKRAIDEQTIKRLHQIVLSARELSFARDIFMLSVYTRGMAFVDMAHLKKSDIRDGYLTYTRHKTGQRLSIKVEPGMRQIIDRYAPLAVGGEYLLPILTGTAGYASALRLQNSRLKRIAEMLGFDTPLSTYVARHSWASLAKRNGVSVQVISESMGHDNETTTRIYLASLDRSVIDDANAMLLSKI